MSFTYGLKCLLASTIAVVATAGAAAQVETDFWDGGFVVPTSNGPQFLSVRPDRLYFAVDGVDQDKIAEIHFAGDQEAARITSASGRKWLMVETAHRDVDRLRARIGQYKEHPSVRAAGPVFDVGGISAMITDELIVHFRAGTLEEDIEATLARFGLERLHEYPERSGRILARVAGESSTERTLALANRAYFDDKVEYSAPNLYFDALELLDAPQCPPPSPLPPPPPGCQERQWRLDAMCVPDAWAIAGQGDVTVFAYDRGFDDDHVEYLGENGQPRVAAIRFSNEIAPWFVSHERSFTASASAPTTVYLYLGGGIGEAILDNVSLLREDDPEETQLVPNGDFSQTDAQGWAVGWERLGTHSQSSVASDDAEHANVLLIKKSSPGFGGQDCVRCDTAPLVQGKTYSLTVETKTASKEVKVLVRLADPGDFDDEELEEKVLLGYIDDYHANVVCGTMVAADDGQGLSGIAPTCPLLFAAAWYMVGQPSTSLFDITSSVYWGANQGASVMNLSIFLPLIAEDINRAFRKVTREARRGKGVVVCFGAGNEGETGAIVPRHAVNSYPLALTVGATALLEHPGGGVTEHQWVETNDGPALDLMAPTYRVLPDGTTKLGIAAVAMENGYVCPESHTAYGTSYASPAVAGVAALMLSVDPDLSRDEVFQILFHTSSKELETSADPGGEHVDAPDPVTGRSDHYGYGRVDALNAVEAVDEGKRWPAPVDNLWIEPRKVPSHSSVALRLTWTNPIENFSGVVVVKSTAPNERLEFMPQDGTTYTVGQNVADAGGTSGRILFVGAADELVDLETTPSGVRYYTVFAFCDNPEASGTVRRYAYGAERSMRYGSVFVVNSAADFATILASNDLEGGDLIWVQAGSYDLITPITFGDSDAGNETDGHVFLVGERLPSGAQGANLTGSGPLLQLRASYVTVQDLCFGCSGTSTTSTGIVVYPEADHVRITSNRFDGRLVGIQLGDPQGPPHAGPVLVQNNIMRNALGQAGTAARAIHCPTRPSTVDQTPPSYYILSNTIVMEEGVGVDFDFQPSNCGNSGTGCHYEHSDEGHTVELYDNVIQVESEECIHVGGPDGTILSNHNNLLAGPAGAIGLVDTSRKDTLRDWQQKTLADKDSISVDPQFVAGTEFEINPESPCVNRGMWESLMAREETGLYPRDYLGKPRFVPSALPTTVPRLVDIGAHENDSVDLGAQFIRGDASGDGRVDITDPQYIFNFLFGGGPPPDCHDSADATDDEHLDISDGIALLDALFHKGEGTPRWVPPPHPECGHDPFGFEIFCETPGSNCP